VLPQRTGGSTTVRKSSSENLPRLSYEVTAI
jgi:hypothetical protein